MAPRIAPTALLLLALLLPGPAPAADAPQPNFAGVTQGPVTVLHAAGEEGFARAVAARAAIHHERIRRDLGLEDSVPVALLLLTGKTPEATREGWAAALPRWFAGAAVAAERFAVIRVEPGSTATDLDSLVAHELTHLVISADYPRSGAWPLWFREGLSMREAGAEGLRPLATIAFASLRGRLLPLASLERRFPAEEAGSRLAYAESASFLAFLNDRFGAERFRLLMRELRRRNFEDAFAEAYGQGVSTLERQWRSRWTGWHASLPLLTSDGVLWGLVVLLFFVAIVVRRHRSRQLREKWEAEDPEEPEEPEIPPDDDPDWPGRLPPGKEGG